MSNSSRACSSTPFPSSAQIEVAGSLTGSVEQANWNDPLGLYSDEDYDEAIAAIWADRAEALRGAYDAFSGLFSAALQTAQQAADVTERVRTVLPHF